MGRNPYAGASSPRLPSSVGPPPAAARNSGLQTDLATLAETIAQATSIIQAAGLTQGNVFSKIFFNFMASALLTSEGTSYKVSSHKVMSPVRVFLILWLLPF